MLVPSNLDPDVFAPRQRWREICLGGGLVVAILLLLGPPRYRTHRPTLDGELVVVGSRAMAEPVGRWVAIFRREHPAVHVTTRFYGSAVAVAALADGTADVAPLVHPVSGGNHDAVARTGYRIGTLRGSGPVSGHSLDIYFAPARCAPNRLAAIEFVEVAVSREGQGQITDRRYIPDAGGRGIVPALLRAGEHCRT